MNLDTAFLDKSVSIAVAWSGGIDSTAVLLWLSMNSYRVEAWHIDHAWREHCQEEDDMLAEIADKVGVRLRSVRLEHACSEKNREMVARQARYAQFEQWSEESGISLLCLGHHIEDQAETVYMRLLSGAGPYGCKGMSGSRKHGKLTICRPALGLYKADLESFLTQNNIPHIEDSSNHDTTILRNRVRLVDMPSMNRHVDAIDLFSRLGQCAHNLCHDIDSVIDAIPVTYEHECVIVSVSDWQKLSDTMKKYLLQKMGQKIHGNAFSFGKRHLNYAASWSCMGGIDITKSRLQRVKKNLVLSKNDL